jgi:predicted ATPase
MRMALERHDAILHNSICSHDGLVFSSAGDGLGAVFARSDDAIAAACEAQSGLIAEPWPGDAPVRVRMAVHTGEAVERDGDYFGPTVNRAARLMAMGHGGQVLVSHATEQLVRGSLAEGLDLLDLGEHRLRDLSRPERVFQLFKSESAQEFPPLRSLDAARTNLPVQLTSFVGREEEVKVVGTLVGEHRVVTLTGVGGVGKTRLALQVAAEQLDAFSEGVWLVELAPLGDASRVIEALAAALSVEPSPGKTIEQAILHRVKTSVVLVVLDNCEHLLDEVRRVVGVLARAAPGLVVLATSREPMGIPGEQVVPLRSLTSESSVRLFTERAVAVDASFALAGAEVELVTHLCRRLDGIPLAIELAAARVRMFSPAELADRLDQRFRLLTGGRGAVERHQTLRAAIDWSYDMLAERDRTVFDRMSAFWGGCILEAAEAVCSGDDVNEIEVDGALSSLIDKSLVAAERSNLATRYRQLETVRQYAEEHLLASGEADSVRERHARYFAAVARDAGRGLWSTEEVAWAQRVEADLDNIRAAMSWAVVAGETDLAMRLAGAFVTQAVARPAWATASIAEQALSAPDAEGHPWRAIVMGEAAWAALRRGDRERASALVEGSIEAQRQGARFTAPVWTYAAMLFEGEGVSVVRQGEEGLARAEAAGDLAGATALRAAHAINLVSWTDHMDDARSGAERSLADARKLEQPALIAMGLLALGEVLVVSGETERGLAALRESQHLSSQINSTWQSVTALAMLAALEAFYGDPVRAASAMRDLFESFHGGTDYGLGAIMQGGLAVFHSLGRPDLVARADGHLRSFHTPLFGGFIGLYDRAVAEARTKLGNQRYEAIAADGAAIPWDIFVEEMIANLGNFLDKAKEDRRP